VPSNQSNLHSLAVAVAMATPVLLQGVVGSGKTTLVEHLARLTGRQGPPGLLKVQLGDQMDSKVRESFDSSFWKEDSLKGLQV